MDKKSDPRTFLRSDPVLRRAYFLSLLGRLTVEWSNLESMFCAVLAKLLKSDNHRTEIVFYSTSTERGRRELIWRVLVVFVANQKIRDEFAAILVRFKNLTATRNKYAHGLYDLYGDPSKDNVTSIRFPNLFEGDQYVSFDPVDKAMINELEGANNACGKLNTELQAFIRKLSRYVRKKPVKQLHTHGEPWMKKETHPPRNSDQAPSSPPPPSEA